MSRSEDPRGHPGTGPWDLMAAWWDEKQGEEGDRWHRLLIEPGFERVLGDVRYRELFQHHAEWRLNDSTDVESTLETPYYHRPLSWYVRAMRTAGLAVTAFEEPEPTEEFMAESSQGIFIRGVPLHCVIEARKLPI